MLPKNAQTHIYRLEPTLAGEKLILDKFFKPGMRALDIGCAATGRSARLLRDRGGEVTSIEINVDAILEFATHPDRAGIDLAAADLAALPFQAGSFDFLFTALHGIDYLLDDTLRQQAYLEYGRLLKPGGYAVLNSFNPVGLAVSPRGFLPPFTRDKLSYIFSLRFLRPTFRDMHNLEMRQTLPQRLIADVERLTGLRHVFGTNATGRTTDLRMLTLLANGPYYVFQKG